MLLSTHLLRLVVSVVLVVGACLASASAQAGSATTRDALDRLDEILELRLDDGRLQKKDLVPALVIIAPPRYTDSEGMLAARSLDLLQRNLGEGNLRLCEACLAPRARVLDGAMAYQSGPIGVDEVRRLDEDLRGQAAPARVAIWIEEHKGGVGIRIVDLRTGGVRFAQNVDPDLVEDKNTQRAFTLAAERERRNRGDSTTQGFFDLGVYPAQHISLDWADQFGKRNQHMAGFTFSLFDPFFGMGANYHFVTPLWNTSVGAKAVLSLPTALVRALGQDIDIDLFDPLVTGVFVARVPFGRSNYGLFGSVSTNGRVTFGISLMNITFLPIQP